MVKLIVRFLLGWWEFIIPDEYADKAANKLLVSGAEYYRMKRQKNGELYFRLMWRDCAPVCLIFERNAIEYKVKRRYGLPHIFNKYKKRVGILVGAILSLIMIFASERFIWSMEVGGNTSVSDGQIISELGKLGVGVGSFIPDIDFDEVHQRFLIENKQIAWISVNVRGTSAYVEVLETLKPDKAPDETKPYNLVASEDGIIEYMEILRGTPIAKENELVREGELLASGIQEGKHGYFLVHSRGQVFAKVKRAINIEIPLNTTKEIPDDKSYYKKSLKFFGLSLCFFDNTENAPEKCDIIKRETPIRFFDTIEVPIVICEDVYRGYQTREITLTENEAKKLAYKQFFSECEKISRDSELVSRSIEAGLSDGCYKISGELVVLKDIAKKVPIYTGKEEIAESENG